MPRDLTPHEATPIAFASVRGAETLLVYLDDTGCHVGAIREFRIGALRWRVVATDRVDGRLIWTEIPEGP